MKCNPQRGGISNIPCYMIFMLVGFFCAALARSEKAAKPIAAGPVEKRRDYRTVVWMSALLTFASGMVNAFAILDLGMTVAHHTGNASHTGRLIGENAIKFFTLMAAFVCGSGIIGYSKSDGEAIFHGRYSPGLLAAAVAVVGGVLAYINGRVMLTLSLWALSQGMQNAITRKCSSMPVCTTHMTGYLTDFGSNVGAIARDGEGGPSPRKPKLFGLSIFAYIAGGYVAKVMLPSFGARAALLPAAIMAIVSVGLMPRGAPDVQDAPAVIQAEKKEATPQVAITEKAPLEGATNLASPALKDVVKSMPSPPKDDVRETKEKLVVEALDAAAKAAQQLQSVVDGVGELKRARQSQKS
jgi:uncharacterized membrane protein YoaK (UPF0700 family)